MDQIGIDGRLEATHEELASVREHRDRVENAMPELQGELHTLRSREELFGAPTMRALTAIAYNPILRRLVLGPIRLLYRVTHPRSKEL